MLKPFFLKTITTGVLLTLSTLPSLSQAAVAGGTAYLSVNQAALATVRLESQYVGARNQVLYEGRTGTMADADGYRYLYVQSVYDHTVDPRIPANTLGINKATDFAIANGKSTPEAVELWRVPHVEEMPVAQPTGGFSFLVDNSGTAGVDVGWAPGFTASTYDSDSNPTGLISLGGSMRVLSDVYNSSRIAGDPDGLITDPNNGINPNSASNIYNPNGGGSLQWRNLDIRYASGSLPNSDQSSSWYIGNSTGPGNGSIFQLIDPVFGINPENGLMTLEADYKFGESAWSAFFLDAGAPDLQTNLVLGHLSINPTIVPLPGAIWLFGSALLGIQSLKRRKSVIAVAK